MLSGEYIVVYQPHDPALFPLCLSPDTTEQVYIQYVARGLYSAIKITLIVYADSQYNIIRK